MLLIRLYKKIVDIKQMTMDSRYIVGMSIRFTKNDAIDLSVCRIHSTTCLTMKSNVYILAQSTIVWLITNKTSSLGSFKL